MVKLGFEIYLISKPMLFPQFFKCVTWNQHQNHLGVYLNSELLSLAPKLLNQNLSQ